ncbi:MFS transporter [Nocardiopsis terrae]|uniref:DHA2 family multidrug resistance protein-like MFS transporter n=1 Tax=Nocardiopsis terrae TaxID=372655 RepID=A0ABR9HJ08_9ACTN|nr:MFS transporter [Nocardiopsis terrae]MBE1459005.1 DHA2 family multidrug resistance protein-like MFS transporter [Nocardiopsis terrae]GHC87572.1 MFS transporter [Nocardiopsis terrae]
MNTTPSRPHGAGARASGREWLGLAVLALPTLLLSLDMSVLYLALPHLAADLRPTGAQTLWIMDVYGFMIAGFLITMGTLGDRVGRRRLLMTGAAAFGLASVAAAFSTSAELLIATRALMGVAGATLMPSTLALISNMFRDPGQRAVAISVWTSCFMGGTAIGPVVGGALLQWFWWGSVFLLGVPVMLLLLVCAPLLLPEYRDPGAGRLDLFSVALSLAAILPVVYGLKTAAEGGSGATALTAVLLGAAVGAWFVRRQLRLPDPLLDLRLFRAPSFGAALAVMMAGAVAMGGTFLLLSQYLQLVAGNSPLAAGLWLVPPALAMIASTMFCAPLAQRVGRANVIGGGMFVSALGFLVLVFVPADGGTGAVVLGLLLTSVGLGPGAALIADIVVGSAPREKAGSAASMSETSGEFGIAIGVALLGSLAAAVYRTRVEVPEGVAEQAAGQTLAGAVAAAEGLPPAQAAVLVESAREAFTAGLNVTAGIGIVGMAVFGGMALWLLRGSAETAAEEAAEEAAEGPREPGRVGVRGGDGPGGTDEFPLPDGSVQAAETDIEPTGRT